MNFSFNNTLFAFSIDLSFHVPEETGNEFKNARNS